MNFLHQACQKLSYISHECMHLAKRCHFRSCDKDAGQWSYHWICYIWKCRATCKPDGSIFSRTGGMGNQSLHWGNRNFLPFLLLWLWPSYTNLTRTPWRYTGCANMNFLR